MFAEKKLEWIIADGTDNLFKSLHARNILDGTELNEPAIDALQPCTGFAALSCSHATASRASLLGEPQKDETRAFSRPTIIRRLSRPSAL
ncbi:hypothetical protein BEN30_13790 [Magnetovibrio blakemorei]|uniref:Uncharacterized protein n=1 Tax=Magnetovibrio blakemorei TaxID=28181 RepID=A0A1E5Q5C2_9PROT|nr:hypothetical protein BEN30_13790 [Magnetovibrio blakemorei]